MRVLSTALGVLLMLLAACTGMPAAAPSQSGTPGAAPSQSGTPAPSPTHQGALKTVVFQPPFTVVLPVGWKLAERGADLVQMYEDCPTCTHEGEEKGEITLGISTTTKSVDALVAELRTARNVTLGAVRTVDLGTFSGVMFTATRTGAAEVQFPDGYHTEAVGLPIDVYVLTAAGRTWTALVDTHEARGGAGEAVRQVAVQVLKSIQIV
jgi:hypothetical protein